MYRMLPAVILLVGAAVTLSIRDQRRVALAKSLSTLPRELDGYRANDLVLSPEEARGAGMSDYVLRFFERDSASGFSVYVGYYDYQTQGRTIHSPRNCLPSNGWEALQSGTARVATAGGSVLVNRYLVVHGADRSLVYYWYQGRGRVVASEYRVKWDLLWDAATVGRTEEALVRVVVPIPRADDTAEALARADRLAEDVTRQFVPAVGRVLPTWPST
jgi:EpsI family protein